MSCTDPYQEETVRRYDDHIVYASCLNKTIPEIYDISKEIIGGSRDASLKEAYNISYTDVYDFASKKQNHKDIKEAMRA